MLTADRFKMQTEASMSLRLIRAVSLIDLEVINSVTLGSRNVSLVISFAKISY